MKRKITKFFVYITKSKILSILLLFGFLNANCQNIITGIPKGTYEKMSSDIQHFIPTLNIINSSGSIENLMKVMNDSSNISLAIVQYDVLLKMQMTNDNVNQKIRLVMPLLDEEVHLFTRNTNKINSVKDLNGKLVAVGSISSGTNVTAKLILSKLGIECKTLDIAYNDAFNALLSGKIDAFFFVGGVPLPKFETFNSEVKSFIKLIPVESDLLDDIYHKTVIKKSSYSWLKNDVKTVSVMTYIVCNTNKDANIKRFSSSVLNNLQKLQTNNNYHKKWAMFNSYNKKVNWPICKEAKKLFVKQ